MAADRSSEHRAPEPHVTPAEPGTGLEIVEVAAPRHTTMRYSIVLDGPKSLVVDLPRGSGTRLASQDDLARALAGGGSSSGGSATRVTPGHGPVAPAPTTVTPAPTPAPERERPQMNPNVYVGPSGDVPSL